MENLLVAENIYKQFGNFTALNNVSIAIPRGSIFGLLGPNGAGKTSLMRVMAGLTKPDQGRMWYRDEAVSFGKQGLEFRRKVSMLQQEPYLFSGSVLKQVCYGLVSRSLTQGMEDKALKSLESLGCMGLAMRHTRQLSGGEKKRVALASLLTLDSEVLLLDEPTAQVDQESSEKILELIQIQLDSGKTLVISTHQPEWAKPLKPRICLLEYGRIASDTLWN